MDKKKPLDTKTYKGYSGKWAGNTWYTGYHYWVQAQHKESGMAAKQKIANPLLKVGEQISVGLPGGGHKGRGEFVEKRIDYNGQHIYKLTGGRYYTNIGGKSLFLLGESGAKAYVDSHKASGRVVTGGFSGGGKGWTGMVFLDHTGKGKTGNHGRLSLQSLTEKEIRLTVPSQYVNEVLRQKRAGMKNVVLINNKKTFVQPTGYVPPRAAVQTKKSATPLQTVASLQTAAKRQPTIAIQKREAPTTRRINGSAYKLQSPKRGTTNGRVVKIKAQLRQQKFRSVRVVKDGSGRKFVYATKR